MRPTTAGLPGFRAILKRLDLAARLRHCGGGVILFADGGATRRDDEVARAEQLAQSFGEALGIVADPAAVDYFKAGLSGERQEHRAVRVVDRRLGKGAPGLPKLVAG